MNDTETERNPYLLRNGITLELTQPEQPTDTVQDYQAVVLEPVYLGNDWVRMWGASNTDREDGNVAVPDGPDFLLSPADARALAAELIAHANAIDPPEADRG
jgi:hypothetical protein